MTPKLDTINKFPYSVKCLEHVWIPMSDGTQLSARIWLPEEAKITPVPAILEYIPYRKRDMTRLRDSQIHPYFAGHGYASVRVDIRGSGDSEGVLKDEYLEQELMDGLDVLAWLAKQPWCNGKTAMMGISWGGFNALQIAALQPPSLKAIITCCSTDDRFVDDIHYMGGCLLGDKLSWSSVMFSYNSLPPDPMIVGDKWRDMWFDRLKGSGLWLEKWLKHQRRSHYWKHGSICENYNAIQIPVYAISGWADGYSNAVFRLLENLSVPCKGLLGPWSHKYPHLGVPGPAIGFLQEALRWWDHWLKGQETGIMQEPKLCVWMQESVPPSTSYKHRPGRWVEEPNWPSNNIQTKVFKLARYRLASSEEDLKETLHILQSPLSVGLFAGKWCSYAAGPDLAHDQRQEDGGALVFDSEPLEEPLEILGEPILKLELSSDKPVAMLVVRLSDIALDGKATRVTYGMLNLTHRDSHSSPKPLITNKRYKITIKLNHIAQVFPKNHKIRIAISTTYWPLAWPPPESTQLSIYTGQSSLNLPIRANNSSNHIIKSFDKPLATRKSPHKLLMAQQHNWFVHRDLKSDSSTLEVINDYGKFYLKDIDLEYSRYEHEWYQCIADDFTSVKGETQTIRKLYRHGWDIKTQTKTTLTSSEHDFYISAELDAYQDNKRVFCNSWNIKIKRDLI